MRILLFLILLTAPITAWAQTIDLFDGQDKMEQKSIEIGSTDGGSTTFDDQPGHQSDGGITIKFERKDSSIMVPAKIHGKAVYFLFDTGATYTTLTSGFARSAGIMPGKDAPTSMMQTANGPRAAAFGLIDNLKLGGRGHANVTFSVCDACPTGNYKGRPVVGLLGLNVVGRYRYSIDEGVGEIQMYPHSAYLDQVRDARPWLELVDRKLKMDDNEFSVKYVLKNRAKRSMREVKVSISCPNRTTEVTHSIPARGTSTFTAKKFDVKACRSPQFDVVSVRW